MIDDKHLEIVADLLDIVERQAVADSPHAVATFIHGRDPVALEHLLGVAIGVAAGLVRTQARMCDQDVGEIVARFRKAVAR